MEWTTATFHYQYDIGDRVYPLGTLVGAPTVYRAGGDYRDDWMSAPFNPALGRQAGAAQVVREGDKLKVALAAFSDAAGHRAETAPGADSGSTVLTDDSGKVLARNAAPGRATFDLPREQGWYRLTVDATRTSPDPVTWMLGTRVTSEWRLRSGHERSAAPARLLDLDYRLPLTGENAADPGKPLGYTVGLTAQGERKALPIASLKVWYATDGTDWKAGLGGPWHRRTLEGHRAGPRDRQGRSAIHRHGRLGCVVDRDADRRVQLRLRRHLVLTALTDRSGIASAVRTS